MEEQKKLQLDRRLLELAWEEDVGSGDVTSRVCVPAEAAGRAELVFRQPGILCGMEVIRQVVAEKGNGVLLEVKKQDGDHVASGERVGAMVGNLRSILDLERLVLNFLGRLSGVATLTWRYVQAVSGTGAGICDTRKTTPGWRELEKYAVRCGGGINHRTGLYDAVLIKDNHLASMKLGRLKESLTEAIARIQQEPEPVKFVEVEVDTLEQLAQVLEVRGVDMVLLDNMSRRELGQAVQMRDEKGYKGQIELEASGGITLEDIRMIAQAGVERISVGALTHSAVSLDVGLDLK